MEMIDSKLTHATTRPSLLRALPGALPERIRALARTEDDAVQLLLRVTLGAVMFPHGAQKLFGWFGGHGFSGTMGFLTGVAGLPALVALLVVLAESIGSLALIAGLFGRVAAAGVAAVMVGAIFAGGHAANGFFMNWAGSQAGEGFEFHLLAIGLALAVALKGSGALSLDRWITGSNG
jgi:putative oxidoreductase